MTSNPDNMEEQNITIRFDREQLLFLASVLIVAGIASNYSTVSPSAFHGILAQSLAQSLLDSVHTGTV